MTSLTSLPYADMALIDGPVGLLLTEAGGRRNAMTISCFSETAHHPTTLWISIAQSCYSHELLEQSGRFTLVVLDCRQVELAYRCGTVSGRDADKCARLPLERGPEGYLFLDGAPASTGCRVVQRREIGDHTLYVAAIENGVVETRRTIYRQLLLSDLTAAGKGRPKRPRQV